MKKLTSIEDVTNLNDLIKQARAIKKDPFSNKGCGENKMLGLLFFNPSLRTRLSTQKAAANLGMNVMVMNLNNDGWTIEMEDGAIMDQGSQEHIKEAAGVISQYCDIIGIRSFASLTDKEQDYQETLLTKFIENAKVPVFSLESATLHPLQSFADLITIEEHKEKNRPKVVLTWAPHPKALPQAVANSFVEWMKSADVDLAIANPENFDLADEFTNGVKVFHDQDEALKGGDFVYAKNWSSFTDYGNTSQGLEHWMITKAKMELTNKAKFMHCLPARRNVVVTDEVIDSADSLVLQQANNRTYAAQTVLFNLLNNEG